MLRAALYRSGCKEARPTTVGPPVILLIVSRPSGQPFSLVLAEETLEQAPVALLVAQDVYDHVLRDQVDLIGHVHDLSVELYRTGLGVYNALYDVHHVGLLLRRLEESLFGPEVHGARHDPVEFLYALGELLRVSKFLLD